MAVKREPPEAGPPPAKKYTTRIKTSALYSNDFTSLLASLRLLGVVKEIRCGDNAIIETAEDLKDVHPSERSDITITMSSPDITIRLGSDSRVHTGDPSSTRARETTDRIAALFSTWASVSPRFIPSAWLIFPAVFFVPLVVILGAVSAVRQEWVDFENPAALAWLAVGASVVPGVITAAASNTRVTVHPLSRFERTERVRKFYGTLVVGLAGGVGGSLLTWFLALHDKK